MGRRVGFDTVKAMTTAIQPHGMAHSTSRRESLMSKNLRTLSAVAAIVGAAATPMLANAGEVTIDFNGLSNGAIGNPYPSLVTFSAGNSVIVAESLEKSVDPSCAPGDLNCLDQPVVLSFVEPAIGNGLFGGVSGFKGLSFNMNTGDPRLSSGNLAYTLLLTSGAVPGSIPDANGGLVYIPFSGEALSLSIFGSAGTWWIDNLTFWTEDATTNVPEPASMALVMLALAGAAASSRRRKED